MKREKEMKGRRRMERGRETERLRGHNKDYLICWEMHGLGRQCPPQGTMRGFSSLTHTANCRRTSVLARGRYCSHNAPGEAPSSSFQNGCRQPPTKADKELGLKAQEPSLRSPQQVWPGRQASPCSPRPCLSRPLVAELLCPGDQGSLCASETNGCSRSCSTWRWGMATTSQGAS